MPDWCTPAKNARKTSGDHDLFLDQVVAMHVDEDVLDEAGEIVAARLDMLVYANGEYWRGGERLARHGFSRRGGGR